LTCRDPYVDAVDGADVAVGDGQAAQLEQRLTVARRHELRFFHDGGHRLPPVFRRRGLLTSSMPASRKTSPTTVSTSAMPGKKKGHHSPCRTLELTCAQ